MRHARLVALLCAVGVVACSGGPGEEDASAGPDAASAEDAGSGDAAAPCERDDDCDDGLFCNGEETCGDDGFCGSGDAPDCDDGIACTVDTCSEPLRECVSEPPDADGDGVLDLACLDADGLPFGLDCDDDDPNRYPGNAEVCDADDHDEDCDDETYGAVDADSDGHDDDACCNAEEGGSGLFCGDDCDDGDADVSPSDTEVCNGTDDDCDGLVDEGFSTNDYYPDCDGDDFGDEDAEPVVDCRPPNSAPSCTGGVGSWVTVGTDCDDAATSVFPGQTEVCNGIDDDCAGGADDTLTFFGYYPDCDGDGFGDEDATAINACAAPAATPSCPAGGGVWVLDGADCDDGATSVFPGQTEICNDVDDNCLDGVDEGLADEDWYPDCDFDTYGDRTATPITDCIAPADPPTCPSGGGNWAIRGGDCDEVDGSVNPGASEACNGTDDDCNDLADDIAEGVVVCALGDSRSCDNACSVGGMQDCANDCLGWTQCDSYDTEVCNYCDDDEDGLGDDIALATNSGDTRDPNAFTFTCIGAPTFGAAACDPPDGATGVMEAVLLDGTAENQAGAIWLNPTSWLTGYGPTEVMVRMRVRAHPENGSSLIETALGGWSIVVMKSGSPGVGSAQRLGVPTGVGGLTAEWHWLTYTDNGDGSTGGCSIGPPDEYSYADSFRLLRGSGSRLRSEGASDARWFCETGTDSITSAAGSEHLGGETSFRIQRLRIRYTPDDPSTTLTDEEQVEVFAGSNLVGSWLAAGADPDHLSEELPAGTPIRIGITAGTWSEASADWAGGGSVGVPVEARVQLWNFTGDPAPTVQDQQAYLTVDGLCQAP